RTLYYNNGYIYMQPRAEVIRRTGADGKPVVDLRWSINEGQPAIVNKIEISGNDVTHERVIRDAIILLPGDVFRQDALIRSYQNISNLGFFQQPLPFPDTRPANDQGDVDVIFRVTEKHTGNVNFGASVGQGTGVGGFLGLDEPNLFGQGKKGHFQWQFGKNISDFSVSYTDPAIHESRISGTFDVHNTRLRYTIADLGTLRRRGASVQFGFPAGVRHVTLLRPAVHDGRRAVRHSPPRLRRVLDHAARLRPERHQRPGDRRLVRQGIPRDDRRGGGAAVADVLRIRVLRCRQ